MKKYINILGVLSILTVVAFAASPVTVKNTSLVFNKKVKKWVVKENVVSGDVVKYVNTLKNSGDRTAADLIIISNIPTDVIFLNKSAKCSDKKGCSITYSVGKNKKFDNPKNLKVKVFNNEGEEVKKTAKPADYVKVRWVVKELKPNASIELFYRGKVR